MKKTRNSANSGDPDFNRYKSLVQFREHQNTPRAEIRDFRGFRGPPEFVFFCYKTVTKLCL